MSDAIPLLVLFAVCGLIVVGSARLGPATSMALSGLWAPQGRPDWPHGVQEMDAPAFEVSHLDALRPGTPVVLAGPPMAGATEQVDPQPEIVELFDRRLRDDADR